MLTAKQLEQVIDQCNKVLNKIEMRDSKSNEEIEWDNFQRDYFSKMKYSAEYYMMGYGVVYYNESKILDHYQSVFS